MALERVPGGWSIRLRFGDKQRGRFLLPDMPKAQAEERVARMKRIAELCANAGKHPEAKVFLDEAAKAVDAGTFAAVERAAKELCAGAALAPKPKEAKTFRDMCDLWLSGELHRRYPDRVPARLEETDKRDSHRLGRVCETIGSVPLAKLTKHDAERALAALPRHLMGSTRAKYAALIPRVLRLAELADLIERSPLPAGWAPSGGEGREFQFLYPEEDAQLMACRHVAFERRLLWGFLVREGLRISEAMRLVWGDIDLDRRSIIVRKSKTGRMRRWRLGEDVALALAAEQERTGAGGDQKVFVQLKHRAAQTFREDLHRCHLRRRELHEQTAESRHVTVHDLRGSTVTMMLATGRPESYIMDRTGHQTSKMLHVYDRASRYAIDHDWKWYGPLHKLLRPGRARATEGKTEPETEDVTGQVWTGNQPEPEQNSTISTEPGDRTRPETQPGPAGLPGVGQDLAEQALAYALRAATDAGRWDVVLEVTRELSERRRAREHSGVPSLDAARERKRNGDK